MQGLVLALLLVGMLYEASAISLTCPGTEGRCRNPMRVIKNEGANIILTCAQGQIRILNNFFFGRFDLNILNSLM